MYDREFKDILRLKLSGEFDLKKIVNCLTLGFVALTLLSWHTYSYAADAANTSKGHNWWFNGGLGVSRFGDTADIPFGMSFSYQIGGNLISIRWICNKEHFALFTLSQSVWE